MPDLPPTNPSKPTDPDEPDRTGRHEGPPTPHAFTAADDIERGTLIAGKYKLLEAIGEGGMGAVWMAQQIEPVKRHVALKLIKSGMDSKTVVARFEAERQALSMMDHPNIARVYDVGTTSTGRPFFVMELVKGTPITGFCDQRKLTPRQRLELFVPVCNAIQHAHQKGVIHRDIKPSNVLVSLHDDNPVPKVIDFGVAKAIGAPLTEKTLHTAFEQVVGTPAYMSPEQATFNQLDIDTRSDVYSLGVLLYELLTGTTPIEKERLKQAAILEILRVVREEEPPRPSTRLSSTGARASIAAVRGGEPDRLSKELRSELDWVVMKSLEKDRARRYDTAKTLAQDVLRYLADEPIEARPPSLAYRLNKLIRRHKGHVFAAILIGLAFLGGIAVAVDRIRVAARNREQGSITGAAQGTSSAEASPLAGAVAFDRNSPAPGRDMILAESVGMLVTGVHLTWQDGSWAEKPLGYGCAFFVSPHGHLITSRRIVDDLVMFRDSKSRQSLEVKVGRVENKLWIFSGRESRFEAEILHVSRAYDLAILKVNRASKRYFALSITDDLVPPTEIESLGFQFEDRRRLEILNPDESASWEKAKPIQRGLLESEFDLIRTAGNITTKSVRVRLDRDASEANYLLHSARITNGNAGGPLISSDGTVLAINDGFNRVGKTSESRSHALLLAQLRQEIDQFVPGVIWREPSKD